MTDLWSTTKASTWQAALDSYDDVVAAQGVERLPALDAWYQRELPGIVAARAPMHVALDELARLTEWKMARGEWRARNLVLVRGNDPDVVVRTTAEAIAMAPHATKPIAGIATLDGVGPATASAVMAAAAPETYPFFDELVAAQVPALRALGPVKWTHGYYAKYATALRERAGELGHGWTPAMTERALWAHAGGKAGAKAHS